MSLNVNSTSPQTGARYSAIKAYCLLGFLWLLVILQYGAVSFLVLLMPVINRMTYGRPIGESWNWSAVAIAAVPFMMLSLGVRRMHAVLERVPNLVAVKQWTAGAAALSLPSIYSYSVFMDKVQRMKIIPNNQGVSDLIVIALALAFMLFGFYMPFILLSCWVKYRYREDEF